MLEPLRREFHVSDARLGALTTIFTVLYAVAGLPLGRLADTWSRRRLAIGVAVWASLTGMGGLAASYAMLLATRLGVGIGEAVCAPVAASWIGDLVPAERRARAMAAFMMAVPVEGMLSFAIGGPVAQAFGWRVALALVPAVLWLKEPGRELGPGAGELHGDVLVRGFVRAAHDGRAERPFRAGSGSRGRLGSGDRSGARDWPSPSHVRDSRAFRGAGGDAVGGRTHDASTAPLRRLSGATA